MAPSVPGAHIRDKVLSLYLAEVFLSITILPVGARRFYASRYYVTQRLCVLDYNVLERTFLAACAEEVACMETTNYGTGTESRAGIRHTPTSCRSPRGTPADPRSARGAAIVEVTAARCAWLTGCFAGFAEPRRYVRAFASQVGTSLVELVRHSLGDWKSRKRCRVVSWVRIPPSPRFPVCPKNRRKGCAGSPTATVPLPGFRRM